MTATTARGAERVLRNAQKNHDYVMAGDFPAWLRAAVLLRVCAAERRLQELRTAS